MSRLTRTDQKFLSFAPSILWNRIPGRAGSNWISKAVVFAAFCSSPASLARLSVKVSAMRNSISGLDIDRRGDPTRYLGTEVRLDFRCPDADDQGGTALPGRIAPAWGGSSTSLPWGRRQ